jgi:tetratricopeptide (TPR) repeat protein
MATIQCPACHKENEQANTICCSCGESLIQTEDKKGMFKFPKDTRLLFVIALIVIGSLILVWSNYSNKRNITLVNESIQYSKDLVSQGDYEEAVKILEDAANIKKTKELEEALSLANTLIKSDNSFRNGLGLLKENKFRMALDEFEKVIDEDTKNHPSIDAYVKQATNSLAAETLSMAKDFYAVGDYKQAYLELLSAIYLSPSLKEAEQLKGIYEQAKNNQEEQERLEAVKRERELNLEQMKKYEYGLGAVGIAVGETKTSSRVDGDFGFYHYVINPQNEQYLWLWIGANNKGTSTVHVNPNDFRVTSPNGYTANYNEASFDVKYLDATNIPPNSYIAGWLIFLVPKADNYVLHYNGLGGAVTKEIILG